MGTSCALPVNVSADFFSERVLDRLKGLGEHLDQVRQMAIATRKRAESMLMQSTEVPRCRQRERLRPSHPRKLHPESV